MANEENLRPGEYKLTLEEQKNGGIRSGEVRRERKKLAEQMQLLLSLPIKNNKAKEQLKDLGLEDNELNNQMMMVLGIYQKALKGDVGAYREVRDTIGELATKVEVVDTPVINIKRPDKKE